jgi:hypothetical protein
VPPAHAHHPKRHFQARGRSPSLTAPWVTARILYLQKSPAPIAINAMPPDPARAGGHRAPTNTPTLPVRCQPARHTVHAARGRCRRPSTATPLRSAQRTGRVGALSKDVQGLPISARALAKLCGALHSAQMRPQRLGTTPSQGSQAIQSLPSVVHTRWCGAKRSLGPAARKPLHPMPPAHRHHPKRHLQARGRRSARAFR